jgi:tripartite-type tricarboxylate transporter receptor subunit TctC
VTIATRKRGQWWPELPTMIEQGLRDFEVTAWYGLVAPAGTPEPVIRRLNAEAQKAIETASVRESLARQGFDTLGGTAEEFRRFMRGEIDKWAKVVKASGASAN